MRILPGDLREMFIVKGLEKILADRDVKKSHLAQLRKACETALGMLKSLIMFTRPAAFFLSRGHSGGAEAGGNREDWDNQWSHFSCPASASQLLQQRHQC